MLSRSIRWLSGLGLVVLGLSLLLVGCGSAGTAAQPLKGNFVGTVPGSNALLALTTSEGKADAYLCDSQALADWFRGAVYNGAFAATAKDGAQLQATVAPAGVDGTLTLPGGQPLAFHLVPATGDAGLYVAQQQINGTPYVGGWILLPDGEQRGSVTSPKDVVATPALDPHHPLVTVPGVGILSPQCANGFIDPTVGL